MVTQKSISFILSLSHSLSHNAAFMNNESRNMGKAYNAFSTKIMGLITKYVYFRKLQIELAVVTISSRWSTSHKKIHSIIYDTHANTFFFNLTVVVSRERERVRGRKKNIRLFKTLKAQSFYDPHSIFSPLVEAVCMTFMAINEKLAPLSTECCVISFFLFLPKNEQLNYFIETFMTQKLR